jgi:hypothetical protein
MKGDSTPILTNYLHSDHVLCDSLRRQSIEVNLSFVPGGPVRQSGLAVCAYLKGERVEGLALFS